MKERLIAIYPQTSYAEMRTVQSMMNGEEQVRQTPPREQATPRMAQEGAGEGRRHQAEQRLGRRFVTPEEARRAWEQRDRGRPPLTEEEKQAREQLIASGIPPVSGGQATVDLSGITFDALRKEGEKLNELLAVVGEDAETLRDALKDIAKIEVPQDVRNEKTELLGRIHGKLREAMREVEERRASTEAIDPDRYYTRDRQDSIIQDSSFRDLMFNNLFRGADASPHQEFAKSFSAFYDEPIYRAFINLLRSRGLEQEATRYEAEREIRETLHDANYAISIPAITTENLMGFVQRFKSELADVAFDIKGVPVMIHMYERALMKVMADNNGFLPYADVVGDPKNGVKGKAEILARQYFQEALQQGLVKKRVVDEKDAQGNITREHWDTVAAQEMDNWEIDRAFSLARGLNIVMLRTLEIASLTKLPPGGELVSLFALDIVRDMAPFRHIIGKFNIGKERLAVLGFLLKRKGRLTPWTTKELEEFVAEMKAGKTTDVLEGLVGAKRGERAERYLSMLNPFKIGSIFSRSTWRVATRSKKDMKEGKPEPESAIKVFLEGHPDNKNWMGTGIRMEKLRDDLVSSDKTKREEAHKEVRAIFLRMAELQPMKLYLHVPEVREYVQQKLSLDRNALDLLEQDLIIVQEKLVQDREELQKRGVTFDKATLDFTVVPEEDRRRERAMRAQTLVREKLTEKGEHLLARLLERGEQEWPFIFGTDDVPYERFQFGRLGGSGIPRRARDFKSESDAAKATMEFIQHLDSFKGDDAQDRLIEALRKIYDGISGYDEGKAREAIMLLAEGTGKFYKKTFSARLPFGIGSLLGAATGRASFAQIAFGRDAMAWDEIQMNAFKRKLREKGMLTPEQEEELGRKIGGNKLDVVVALLRTAVPLVLLAFLYYLLTRIVKEEPKA